MGDAPGVQAPSYDDRPGNWAMVGETVSQYRTFLKFREGGTVLPG